MKELVYLRNVSTLQIDESTCIGCGMCLDVCPHAVLAMNGRKAHILNRDACMECGACSRNCPVGAVSVQAGVGCAAAVINGMLGRSEASCCCVVDPKDPSKETGKTSCC